MPPPPPLSPELAQNTDIRRSDFIESIHDGSFFGDYAKLWVFLPSALMVVGLWVTGMVLFFHPYVVKSRKRRAVVR